MLTFIRTLHTIIYIIMAGAVFFVLYCGIAGYFAWPLYVALALVSGEAVVFLGNGMKCPLTTLTQKYGAEKGYAFDTFLPEKFTRYTFRFFGSLYFIALIIIAFDWLK